MNLQTLWLALLFSLAPVLTPTQSAFASSSSRLHATNMVAAAPGGATTGQGRAVYDRLPLSFEMNRGQAPSQVRFLAHGSGYNLFLTGSGAVFVFSKSTSHPADPARGLRDPAGTVPAHPKQAVVHMALVGSTGASRIEGLSKLPGKVNYLIGGDRGQWHTNIPTYARVVYKNVYRGVDLAYHGNQGHFEYDFVVAPGGEPSRIRLRFQGVHQPGTDAEGNLLLRTSVGEILQQRPIVYQTVHGVRQLVPGRYALDRQGRVGFALGAYNTARPLVIDPTMVYSTYLGGTYDEIPYGIAVGSSGNVYLAGMTSSVNFPTTSEAYAPAGCSACSPQSNTYDIFVTQLNAAGSGLVYSTYLGGSGDDEAYGLALDGAGNAYVTGMTNSGDFPTTTGAFQTTFGGTPYQINDNDAFVSKLNSTGSALMYSTYLGGAGDDRGVAVAVDASDNAYVTGTTGAYPGAPYPTTAGAFQTAVTTNLGASFVSKLNSSGSSLVYSTFVAGSDGYTLVAGIALDASNNAYLVGHTYGSTTLPTTPGAFQTSPGPDHVDAFVTKLNATGSGLVYSSYLAGSGEDYGTGIGVDASGNAYVCGRTKSSDFPTTAHAFRQHAPGGYYDVFVTKMNATGSAPVYSTYLGGSQTPSGGLVGNDQCGGLTVDAAGNAYVTGLTNSLDFPVTANAIQPVYGGENYDAFLTKVDATGSFLAYSSYLGGSGRDFGNAVAVDASSNAYVTGYTSGGFPTTSGAFQSSAAGGYY